MRYHEFGITFAHVVTRKSAVDSTTQRLAADLDWLGLRRWVFQSDQERAVLATKQAVLQSMAAVEFVLAKTVGWIWRKGGTECLFVLEAHDKQNRIPMMQHSLEPETGVMTCRS